MGLDITAYRSLKRIDEPELGSDGQVINWLSEWQLTDELVIYTESHFPGRTAGLEPGVYSYDETVEFKAGSYSHYNEWRDKLAILAGYGSAGDLWYSGQATGPFVELINFSDCEGVIGPTVSAKLARDFQEHETLILAKAEEWFVDRYRLWRKAFELAADNGAVDFH